MSQVTAGAVVDAVTSRGMNQFIVVAVNGERFSAYQVAANDHTQIVGEHEGETYEIIGTYEDERALIVPLGGHEDASIIVFRQDDHIRMFTVGDVAPVSKSLPVTVDAVYNALVKTLSNLGNETQEKQMLQTAKFYRNYIAGALSL